MATKTKKKVTPSAPPDMVALGRKGGLRVKKKLGRRYFAELARLRVVKCNVCRSTIAGGKSGDPCHVAGCQGVLRMPGGRPPGSLNKPKAK